MWNQKPSFRFEIDNLSEKEAGTASQVFVSGGCEWCLSVYPKGYVLADGHLSLYLNVANRTTLRAGWERSAEFYFVLLNQSDKELCRSSKKHRLFCAETPGWGYHRMLPLTKLEEEGFLENNKLTIEVYIKVVKVVDQGRLTEDEMVDVFGFHVLNSQVVSMSKILIQHPDVAVGIKSAIKEVKTAYMNILLGLTETLDKAPQSLSETELRNADSELRELTEAGFKLDWLRSKLEEVLLKRKKASSNLKAELEKEKTKDATADHAPTAELEKEKTKDATAPKTELEKEETKSVTAAAPKAELEKEKTKDVTAPAPKTELEKEETKDATAAAPKTELEKEETKSVTAAALRVSPFGCIDILVKIFLLSCFSEH